MSDSRGCGEDNYKVGRREENDEEKGQWCLFWRGTLERASVKATFVQRPGWSKGGN